MSIRREAIEKCIVTIQSRPFLRNRNKDRLAICYLMVENYTEAKHLFRESCQAMLEPAQKRFDFTFPNRLVDAYVLSGEAGSYGDVMDWLITYRLTTAFYTAYSPVACYSYSVMELLSRSPKNITSYIQILLKKPKLKDMYAIGLILQAILNKDNDAFETSLSELLNVHTLQVKRGSLRQAGIDFQCLCMYAMSLSYLGNSYGLLANKENEYFSAGYLEFLAKTDS